MSMDCGIVRQRVSAYLDGAVPAEERDMLRRHFGHCRECALESERYEQVRETLRSLPRLDPPAELTTRLRVAASKARMESFGGTRWSRLRDRVDLMLSNLMRPLALPAVGGLCSAVFLFSTLVPLFKSAHAMGPDGDIPTMLNTVPMLKYTPPVAFDDRDAVVDLQLNEQGRIVDFTIVSAPGPQNEAVRRSIENNLLFTEFVPATTFGHPVAYTIRISFHNSSPIDVRG
jgi:hypothetical protein